MINKAFLFYLLLFSLVLVFISATCSRKQSQPVYGDFPHVFIPDGIGVNIHFSGAPERDLKLMDQAHIKLIRADLTWTQVERKKGMYNFSKYDALVDSFEKQGGRILFILDYKNRLYGKEKSIKTEEQINGFARFAGKAAQRYRGRCIIWEIWNEPNIKKFWGEEPDPKNYMALVKATCMAIREADPHAIIIAPATVGCDGNFISKCAQWGLMDLVDGISVHPYREGGPETVLKCYANLRKIADKYPSKNGKKPRIISSEWGWGLSYLDLDSIGKAGAETKQAAYLTRRFCIEAYAGIACAIYYKWREDNHGMIRRNYTLKPSYTAFKVLNEELSGYCKTVTRMEIGNKEKDFVLIFKGDSGSKLVAWTTEGNTTIAIPMQGKKAKGVDFLGKPAALRTKNNILDLKLTGEPIFIEY